MIVIHYLSSEEKQDIGPVQTYPYIFENGAIFLRIRLQSTRKQCFW